MVKRWAYQGATLLFVAVSMAACASPSTPGEPVSTNAPITAAAPATTHVAATTTTVESTTAALPTTTTTVTVSSDSLAYAKSLGGTSHEGETLYFVIGASVESEREAQATLEDAIPLFGDMQSYFIVQRSDNFQGMEPGWWVILEAFRSEPSPENLAFDRRGFPDAYVKSATVRTSDPIPVYEDLVGGP